MKLTIVLVALLVITYIGYEVVRMSRLVKVSGRLVEGAEPYQSDLGERSLLVLGDSTAVGVGAASDGTVAARLGNALDASVENYAKSGAVTSEIATQFSKAKLDHYDVVLIQIGANDIIRFHSVDATDEDLRAALDTITKKSGHVVLLTAGKVGEAPFFPRLFGWLWTRRAAQVRTQFMAASTAYGVAYVDLYNGPDPFKKDPQRYYAPDGLHLTADGYRVWAEQVEQVVFDRWPELRAHE